MKSFGIIVGRWSGPWAWVWYADVMHKDDVRPYTSFNALSKRGALRKAKRYINRIMSPIEDRSGKIYYYDEDSFKTGTIDV
jgi:hypothetical protein